MNFRFIRTNDGIALKIDAATTDEIAALNELLLDRRMRTAIKPVVRVDNIMEGNQVKSIVVSQKCYLTREYLSSYHFEIETDSNSIKLYSIGKNIWDAMKNGTQYFHLLTGSGRYCGFRVKRFVFNRVRYFDAEKAFRFYIDEEEVFYLKLSKKKMSIQTLGDLIEFMK